MMSNIDIESSDRTKMIQAKIHLFEDNMSKKRYSMTVPVLCDETEIIKTIIPVNQVIKEKWGYRLIDGETEKRVTITFKNRKVKTRKFPTGTTRRYYRIDVKSGSFSKDSLLMNNKECSDIVLCVNGKNIHAHKKILAKASAVFKTKIDTDPLCKKIVIDDISIDTASDMLTFIYKEQLPDVYSKNTFIKYTNLLKADVKYCVVGLQTKCMEEFARFLTIKNVIDFLEMADASNSSNLRQLVIQFIVDNEDELIRLPSYHQTYIYQHPEISAEIVRVVIAKQLWSAK